MIPIVLILFTAFTYYSIAKKVGVSKVKWTLIGVLVASIPLALIPRFIIQMTGRNDLDGPALMVSIVFVIISSSIIQRRIKPESDIS